MNRNPSISLSIGPGHHGERLAQILAQEGLLHQAIHSWPGFRIDQGEPLTRSIKRGAPRPVYGHTTRLTWGLWRRLPLYGRTETPKAWLFDLFDRLAEAALLPCDLFVGWSQLSLRSLERARLLGARTLLEHPMSHVDTWMAIVEDECRRFPNGKIAAAQALFPYALVRRMREECHVAERISVLSSYAQKTFLRAGISADRLVTVPMGVDPERFVPRRGGKPQKRALFVGRLELLKGVPYLLSAFCKLKEGELWLAGPVLEEIRPVLDRATAGCTRIRVLGEVPKENLPALYQEVDVLVFPSLNDAFGLVLLEAMASGLPVIATDHSAGADLVTHEKDGFLVPIRHAEAIETYLERLFASEDQRRQMGQEARAKVVAHFTWADYARRIHRAFFPTQGVPRET